MQKSVRVRDRFTNPLDWKPINKNLLLAFIVLFFPISGIVILSAVEYASPGYFNPGYYEFFIVIDLLHLVTISGFILVGLAMRKYHDNWAWIEHAVIISYLTNVIISSYLTGTYLTYGLIYIAMGIAIVSVIGDIVKIRYSIIYVYILMAAIAILDLGMGVIPHAPALPGSLYDESGTPLPAWKFIQLCLLLYPMMPFYLMIISVLRWVEREKSYKKMSMEDGLTGLMNRRTFLSRAQAEMARLDRDRLIRQDCDVGFIMIDLDHFKQINDTYGHAAGDAVLKHCAEVMQDSLRSFDLLGRFGGEEFAIMTPNLDADQLRSVADRLCVRIGESAIDFHDQQISVTASLGVVHSSLPGSIRDVPALLKQADLAMYQAKRSGRNQVVDASTLS